MQRDAPARHILAALCVALMGGCGDAQTPPTTAAPASVPVERGLPVASLSPAATDLLVAMGLADRLVAVSNFDAHVAEVAGRPRAGDYQTIDWEKLAHSGARVMVVQGRADRLPADLAARAREAGVHVVAVQIDALTDVFVEIDRLGAALGEPAKAQALLDRLRGPLLEMMRAADRAPRRVPALVLTGDGDAPLAAARSTYLDDLLTAAGGANVLAPSHSGYVALDAEALSALRPEAVLVLAPTLREGGEAEVVERLARYADWPAVRDGRVRVLRAPWALVPGSRVVELAEWMRAALAEAPS